MFGFVKVVGTHAKTREAAIFGTLQQIRPRALIPDHRRIRTARYSV
ncbi:protein of unknown function [Methylocaldum szegediense]|uniref:Transposase n=1 Tax=Methylocaldum szegediense TaxID=73780 RepID=A0ABM9I215_9GAMM|nr:protein of unknown function [Methylocaldum szegediense]